MIMSCVLSQMSAFMIGDGDHETAALQTNLFPLTESVQATNNISTPLDDLLMPPPSVSPPQVPPKPPSALLADHHSMLSGHNQQQHQQQRTSQPIARNPLYSSLPKLGHDAWRRSMQGATTPQQMNQPPYQSSNRLSMPPVNTAGQPAMRPAYSWGHLPTSDYAHQYNQWLYEQQAAAQQHQMQQMMRNLFPYTTVHYGHQPQNYGRTRSDLLAHLMQQQQPNHNQWMRHDYPMGRSTRSTRGRSTSADPNETAKPRIYDIFDDRMHVNRVSGQFQQVQQQM